jgi:hypothetical protein
VNRPKERPSAAKADVDFIAVSGTAKAVPFQSNEFFRGL